MADREWIWRGMIGDWQDEWDLKRPASDRSVNGHDTCRVSGLFKPVIAAELPPRRTLRATTTRTAGFAGISLRYDRSLCGRSVAAERGAVRSVGRAMGVFGH